MRRIVPLFVVALAVALPAAGRAESDTDRLRDALRAATAQLRALEDQRAALQAKQAESERERDRLQKQNNALKAQVKELDQANRQAVEDFNQRLAERDQTLEKWKSAYEEAANVARTKDAERAKFEQEAKAFKASTKATEAKNAQLYNVSKEILNKYEAIDPLEALAIHEPLIGIKRVEHQNSVQDYRDKILDQKAKP
jgi:chromosome segregation ATPase